MPTNFDELWSLAEHQHGLVLRHQAVALLGEPRVDRLVAAGRLRAVGTDVYRVPGAPRAAEQTLLAAVFASGSDCALASGRSAAWLWGLVEAPPRIPEVMVPHGRLRRLPGIRLVRSLDCTPEVGVVRRGIPTLNPLLTMVELARVLDPTALADALERGLANSLFSMAAMWATLDRYGRSGRNGIGPLRAVVEHRALEDKPSDSVVEERCAQLLAAHGITGWVFHQPIRDERGAVVAEPDFTFAPVRLGVEIEGVTKFHQRGYLDRFAERRHRLRALGWDLEHFTWGHVVRRPAYLVATLTRLLADRAAALGVPLHLFLPAHPPLGAPDPPLCASAGGFRA